MNDYNVKVWSRVICNHLLLQNTSFVVPSFDCQLSRVTVSEGIVYLKHSEALSRSRDLQWSLAAGPPAIVAVGG